MLTHANISRDLLLAFLLALFGTTPIVATLRSEEALFQEALELLESPDCGDRLRGLQILDKLHRACDLQVNESIRFLETCNESQAQARAILLGPVDAVGFVPDKEQLALLSAALHSDSEVLRGPAALALSKTDRDIQAILRSRIERSVRNVTELVFYCSILISTGDVPAPCLSLRQKIPTILREMLDEEPDEVLAAKSEALIEISPCHAIAQIPDLVRAARACGDNCLNAYTTIRTSWVESDEASPALISCLNESHALKIKTLRQIAFLRVSSPQVLLYLRKALTANNVSIVHHGLTSAGEIGPPAAPLLPFIREIAVRGRNEGLRRTAALSFLKIASPEEAEALIEEIKVSDSDLARELASHLLLEMLDH